MKIQIEIPDGTLMLIKAEQIFLKTRDKPLPNTETIIVRRLEESYRTDPLTPKLIKIQQEVIK